jgi:outer membrane immunogenic protein
MRGVLLCSVALLTVGTLDFATATETTPDAILARIEAIEKENALLRREVADLRKLAKPQSKNVLVGASDQNQKRSNSTKLSSVNSNALSANASRLPSSTRATQWHAKVPLASSTFNWTGCYVGVHAGAGTVMASENTITAGAGGMGALSGGQIGCNYQTGMLVLGVEGEGWWSSVKSAWYVDSVSTQPIGTTTSPASNMVTNKWDMAVAARFGLAIDRALIYGKAGFVSGRFDFYGLTTCSGNCGNGAFPNSTISTLTGSANMAGLLIGLGLEYAFYENWSAKFEYDYLNYFTTGVSLVLCQTGNGCDSSSLANVSERADKQVVKVGLNYIFK